jgi:HSP20 family molecular chaperone IbpA
LYLFIQITLNKYTYFFSILEILINVYYYHKLKYRHHINEICYGKFSRSFELPAHIDSDKIDAKWNEGILNVTIPKTEKAKPKKIKIN